MRVENVADTGLFHPTLPLCIASEVPKMDRSWLAAVVYSMLAAIG